MKVESLPLTAIRPYWRNPRDNGPAVEAVKTSIARYGFLVPLVLDGSRVIVTGHTRYKAAMELGLTEVPCVIADLDPQKAKEFRIADNKTSEFAGWNLDALIPELREIKDVAGMGVYFPEYDLGELLAEAGGSATIPVTAEETAAAQRAADEEFTTRGAERQAAYVELLCPHCGNAFYGDRNEIERAPAVGPHG